MYLSVVSLQEEMFSASLPGLEIILNYIGSKLPPAGNVVTSCGASFALYCSLYGASHAAGALLCMLRIHHGMLRHALDDDIVSVYP